MFHNYSVAFVVFCCNTFKKTILLDKLYVFLIIGLVIAGIVLFCVNFKKIHFRKTEYSVPEGKRFATYFVNIGVLVYTIYWIIRIILQLFS